MDVFKYFDVKNEVCKIKMHFLLLGRILWTGEFTFIPEDAVNIYNGQYTAADVCV